MTHQLLSAILITLTTSSSPTQQTQPPTAIVLTPILQTQNDPSNPLKEVRKCKMPSLCARPPSSSALTSIFKVDTLTHSHGRRSQPALGPGVPTVMRRAARRNCKIKEKEGGMGWEKERLRGEGERTGGVRRQRVDAV